MNRAKLGLLAAAAGLTLYLKVLRPRHLRWGATDEEVQRRLPGDDLVARPAFNATRAITIEATPDEIWPWLLQIGCRRAGWYSYDWIDNLGTPSSKHIIPELQEMKVGQIVPFSPDGKQGVRVKALDPRRWMLWTDKEDKGETAWYWGLDPLDSGHTRLITRLRIHYNWKSPVILLLLLTDVGDVLMMRKCMQGIKRRAEALYTERRTIIEAFENVLLEGMKHG